MRTFTFLLITTALAGSASAEPVRIDTGWDTSNSLNDWITSAGANWINEAGDGVVQLNSADSLWKSIRQDGLVFDDGYILSFRVKVTDYGSVTPFYARVWDGTYAMEIKFLADGISAKTDSGWQSLAAAVPEDTYISFELCADGQFMNVYRNGAFDFGYTMPEETHGTRIQFLANGSAADVSRCRMTSLCFSAAPVVSGNLDSWKATEADVLCDLIPDSPLADAGGAWSSSVSEAYDPSGSEWSITSFSEESVFQALLKHNQFNGANPVPHRSWELRLGKGGQIYSLLSAIGETVPPQYRDDCGGEWAPWMDEVWQSTMVNTQNEHYFHHQAGVYLNKYREPQPELDAPFYSPMLTAGTQGNKTYVTASWSQQAHVPTPYRSHCITYQKTRNAGAGIIEVTTVIHNFGATNINFCNTPWGGVRRSSYDVFRLSQPDGSLTVEDPILWDAGALVELNDTAGWAAYANGPNMSSSALGFVFGFDHSPLDGFQRGTSRWRWGNAGGADTGNETDWRNYLVSSLQRRINLYEDETFYSRYYMVIAGQLTTVSNQVSAYSLPSCADYGQLFFSATNTPTLDWYVDANDLLTTTVQSGQTPWVTTYAAPVPDSQPLFYLRSVTSDRLFVSTNPYLLCNPPKEGYAQKPYDGFTETIGFLGYIIEE